MFVCLESCCACVETGFIAWLMESARSRSFVIFDIIFYSGPLVGDVGGVGVGFLVRLCVHAALG